ncbi:putative ataxin-2 -like protein isoform X1 [Capsicum annuum]|nr:putative ataxin-2 -like protein isoform X1 [Capsicum annuum]
MDDVLQAHNKLSNISSIQFQMKYLQDCFSFPAGTFVPVSNGRAVGFALLPMVDGKYTKVEVKDEEDGLDEEEEEHGDTLCGACGENYASDEFWICCDLCERWFHGKCVKITPAKAEHIKQYKCPSCSNKRPRP